MSGTPSKHAVDWMMSQGLPRFDTNSGRKALAKWCKMLHIPYRQSVHIHGDVQESFQFFQILPLLQ